MERRSVAQPPPAVKPLTSPIALPGRDWGLQLAETAAELFGFTQRHLNAYLARDGVCVDVHLSKVLSKPGEDPQFDAVVDSIRLVEVRR